MSKEMISIIIPCYNSEKSIRIVVEEILDHLSSRFDVRIILVDDYSKDLTWNVIVDICEQYKNVIGLHLAQNFGQQSARMAALPYIKGSYVVFMDDDGQHRPSAIISMIEELQKGYDIVYAYFKEKKEGRFKRFGSWVNYQMTEIVIKKPKDARTSSFFVVKSFVAEALKNYTSPFPYTFGYFMQITKNISSVEVDHQKRIAGTSGYSFKRLLHLWLDGFTGFSVLPLKISSWCGCFFAIAGFIYAIVIVIRKILHPEMAVGYASMIFFLLVIGGIILLMLGILGEYMGRVLITLNRVPQYVVRDIINSDPTVIGDVIDG
ncbi:MAG: glycosyltransferase family 2 protein [Ruminococcus flavefaciens]|nr:glycosyltransferase family 2 protein [Ruminococcus flavefaciens]